MADIKDQNWLKSLCRAYTEANVRTLAGWANGKDVNDDLKMRAILALMDRGWGKPNQPAEAKVDGELRVTIRRLLTKDDDDNDGIV